MYIVAIAWIYVVLLMSFTETSVVAGIATFMFYGLAPLALFLWLMGTPQRRRNRRKAQIEAEGPAEGGTRTLIDAGQVPRSHTTAAIRPQTPSRR